MLSVSRCRKFLKSDIELSDEEIEKIRNSLYELANIAITTGIKRFESDTTRKPKGTEFKDFLEPLSQGERDELEERAGIMEIEGGFSCDEAERLAIAEYIEGKKN